MPNDIDLLKQELLAYLSFLMFPSPEILVKKIPSALQETKLNDITLEINSGKNLSIKNKNDATENILLNKDDLGRYGLSIEDFRKGIKDIKKHNPKKIFSEAIEEVITVFNKKILEIYISLAILAYTNLYEKFKLANPKATPEEIYDQINVHCQNEINELEVRYYCLSFTLAYQYPNLDSIDLLKTIPFFHDTAYTIPACLNILNAVKDIQLTSYRKKYINLTNSIEELSSLQVKNKNATNDLAKELKNLTKICFSHLIQTTFYEQTEKFTREKDITKKFRNDCKQLIETYQTEHPDEFKKQRSILNRILWMIARLIPSSILSKEKKMTLFGDKITNNRRRFTQINTEVDQLAMCNYFSRVISKF